MTKVSEMLFKVKQLEQDILRRMDLRNEIAQRNFSLKEWEKEKLSYNEIEKLDNDFLESQKKRINDITSEIEGMKKDLFELKTSINKVNIENNIDGKLLEVKWLRIELSKLMELTKSNSYGSDKSLEKAEEIGIMEKIHHLENKKQKIDSEIQNLNTIKIA